MLPHHARVTFRFRRWLPSVILCVLGALLITSDLKGEERKGRGLPSQSYPLKTLAQLITQAAEAERRDFAWIAVAETAAAYEREYTRSAFLRPAKPRARRKLYRWRGATKRFVDELGLLLGQLDLAANVQIDAASPGPVVLFIDRNPIVISSPVIGAARLMERRIIDAYCALHDCKSLFQNPKEAAPFDHTAVAPGTWSFDIRNKASFETNDGLKFVFSSASDREKKQAACQSLAKELRILVTELYEAMRAEHEIDWNILEVQQLPGENDNRVVLNTQGDYLRIILPRLEKTALLNKGAINWVKARLMNESHEVAFYHAEKFMNSALNLEKAVDRY